MTDVLRHHTFGVYKMAKVVVCTYCPFFYTVSYSVVADSSTMQRTAREKFGCTQGYEVKCHTERAGYFSTNCKVNIIHWSVKEKR